MSASKVEEAMAVRARAEDERRRGDLDAAIASYEEAIRLYRELGDTDRLAHTIRHLGDIYCEAGRPAPAEPLYREALALYRANAQTRTSDLANAVRPLALLLENAGAIEEATRLWQEAHDLYAVAGIEAGVAGSAKHLARLRG